MYSPENQKNVHVNHITFIEYLDTFLRRERERFGESFLKHFAQRQQKITHALCLAIIISSYVSSIDTATAN